MVDEQPKIRGTWSRRLLTIPSFTFACLGLWATLPIWGSLLVLYETTLGRGTRYSRLRTVFFIGTFLFLELVGILVSLCLWLLYLGRHRSAQDAYHQAHYRLQSWWAKTNFAATRRIFGLTVRVENAEVAAQGPYILFVRHSSIADTLLASVALSEPYGMSFRYVLKQELLWDPCLDIVGQRLPNVFLSRKRENRQSEITAISNLAEGLEGQNGILIYPEGTRYTPGKLKRILAKDPYADTPEIKALAETFRNVLPPKPGGVSALLRDYPALDVVFLEHHGFENGVTFKDFWTGAFVGNTISLRFRRTPAKEIPRGLLNLWLFEQWKEVDDWVTTKVREQEVANV